MAKTAFFTHEAFLKHKMGDMNPESPARLEKINELMFASGADDYIEKHTAVRVSLSDMLSAHDPDYIQYLSRMSPQ